jgi:hypothetical protein
MFIVIKTHLPEQSEEKKFVDSIWTSAELAEDRLKELIHNDSVRSGFEKDYEPRTFRLEEVKINSAINLRV